MATKTKGVIYGEYIPLEKRIAHQKDVRDRRRNWLEAQHAKDPRCRYCRLPTELKHRGFNQREGVTSESRHATLDHIIPQGRGGTDWHENWALACHTCNWLKADMSEGEYIALLREEGIRD